MITNIIQIEKKQFYKHMYLKLLYDHIFDFKTDLK